MQHFTEIFPTKCLNHLSSTRQAAGFINNASLLINRFRQLVFRSFFRRSGFFSHQLASFCQFLDVDITSNWVLKGRGAKIVFELLPCFGEPFDRCNSSDQLLCYFILYWFRGLGGGLECKVTFTVKWKFTFVLLEIRGNIGFTFSRFTRTSLDSGHKWGGKIQY